MHYHDEHGDKLTYIMGIKDKTTSSPMWNEHLVGGHHSVHA